MSAPAVDPALLPFVLASASPRRHELLARLGFAFSIRPAELDETPAPGLQPAAVAEDLALRKARAIAATEGAGTVIGADTVVACRGVLLGKPADAAEAARFLRALSGTTHDVITGVALVHPTSGSERSGAALTRVTMRALAEDEIAAYVASGEPFGKAGGYAIQETGDRFVTTLDGAFDNVVGFPSATFLRLVAELQAALSAGGRTRAEGSS